MDIYVRVNRGFAQRLTERILINKATIKFMEEIEAMYEAGMITAEEWRQLLDMV